MANDEDLPAALAAFEVTFAEDLRRGQPATAAEYAARFPGFEVHIERAYRRCQRRWQEGQEGAVAPDMVIAPGSLLGPYRLEREIGRGGQGTVFVAEDTRLRRRVAIKVLDRLGAVPADTLRRFAREAAIVSRLDHPALCALFDTGEHAGTPFLVMRFVEGETLARGLARARDGVGFLAPVASGSQLAQRRTAILTLLAATARALHAAHEAGVVHRDVKPGNLMLTPDGAPVVLDFGLALDERDEGRTLTRSGDVLGTPFYMAPEQLVAARGPIDRRTDVWALGVVLFECLTLRRPFSAPTTAGLCSAVLHDPLPSTRLAGARQPRDLEVVIATALERDLSRRYQSALEFADDLGRILRHEPIHARPAGPWLRSRRWVQRHPGRAALAALAVLALATLAAAAGFLAARRPLLELGAQAARAERLEASLSEAYFAAWNHEAPRAVALFRTVLAEDPSDPEALAGLALALGRMGDKAAAVAELDTRAPLLHTHAALRRLHAYLSASPADVPPLAPTDTALDFFVGGLVELERARELVDRKVAEKALELLTGAILRSRTARSHYFVLRGSVAGFTPRRADVARETAAILETNWPERPSASYWAGVAWANIDARPAAECFARACARDPDDERSARQLSMQLALTGKDAEALAVAEQLVRRRPDLATSHEALAKVHEIANRFDDALVAARAATQLDPRLPVPYLICVTTHVESGDAGAARVAARACLAVAPGHPLALAQLGMIETDGGETDEGQALYEGALRSDPFMPPVWWNMGYALVNLGRLHEGHAALARALEMTPGATWVPASAAQEIEAVAADVARAEAELTRIAGQAELADERWLVRLAEAASFRAQWPLSASLWVRALEAPGAEVAPPGASRRTRAARAALQTGEEAYRERARGWLAAEFAQWQAAQGAGTLDPERVAQRLARWREDPVLRPVLPEAASTAAR